MLHVHVPRWPRTRTRPAHRGGSLRERERDRERDESGRYHLNFNESCGCKCRSYSFSLHSCVSIHTDTGPVYTRAGPRNDENTRPSPPPLSLRVRPCKILSSFSPRRLHLVYPWVEGERDKCRNLPLSPPPFLSHLPPFLYPSIFTRVYLSAGDTKVSRNCTNGHKRRLSPIVFTETAFPLRTHRGIKAAMRRSR